MGNHERPFWDFGAATWANPLVWLQQSEERTPARSHPALASLSLGDSVSHDVVEAATHNEQTAAFVEATHRYDIAVSLVIRHDIPPPARPSISSEQQGARPISILARSFPIPRLPQETTPSPRTAIPPCPPRPATRALAASRALARCWVFSSCPTRSPFSSSSLPRAKAPPSATATGSSTPPPSSPARRPPPPMAPPALCRLPPARSDGRVHGVRGYR